MISSGVLVAIQFLIFLFIGTLLYAFYDSKQFGTPDEIFPTFVLNHIPAGLRGLILSAMFAAAMSTSQFLFKLDIFIYINRHSL